MEEALKADGELLPSDSGLARSALELPTPGHRAGDTVAGEAEAAVPVSIDPPIPGA
jgi:hypothetical protein